MVVFIFSKDASIVGMQLYQKLTLQLVLSCNFSEISMTLFEEHLWAVVHEYKISSILKEAFADKTNKLFIYSLLLFVIIQLAVC